MSLGGFCPDIVRLLATLLEARDVMHVGMTCKALMREILDNSRFWRFYVLHRFPSLPTTITLESELSWKSLAFCSSAALVKQKLQHAHLLRRLEAGPALLYYLRLFCRLATVGKDDKIVPDQILVMDGSPTPGPDGQSLRCTFRQLRGNALYWIGENDIRSHATIYAVDRQRPGPTIEVAADAWAVHPRCSTLSKSQYEIIGKIAHDDPTFYLSGGGGLSYNYTTDHGSFRSGQERYGFAANSRATERPNVRVQCWVSVMIDLDLNYLYDLFCTRK